MNDLLCTLTNRLKAQTPWPRPDNGVIFTTYGSIYTLQSNPVELSVTFEKDIDDQIPGFVTYFISGKTVLCNREETHVQVRFELRISARARNFDSLIRRWDNIGLQKTQTWMRVQSVVNFNQHGEKNTLEDALSIARELLHRFPEMEGARAVRAFVDADGENSDDEYP
jgi:hypothetical protein